VTVSDADPNGALIRTFITRKAAFRPAQVSARNRESVEFCMPTDSKDVTLVL
jgi:hypothetical protein